MTHDVRINESQNSMELYYIAQSSSQNENIVNTCKKLLKTRYWTFPLQQYFKSTFSQIFCKWLELQDIKLKIYVKDVNVRSNRKYL